MAVRPTVKKSLCFPFLLLASSLGLVFAAIGSIPLIDWDEAIYADVARNTLSTGGNWLTLMRFGVPWFEKPPLYIWLVMMSIRAFGTSEFVLRLPSALCVVVAVLLLYFIILELNGNKLLSFFTALILLFTSPFFLFGTQSRMDVPVTAAILFSTLCLLKGRKYKKWLVGFGIGIALGILIKNIIGLLAFLPAISYGIVYRDWSWIKCKYLWFGFGIGLLIILPWHLYETIVYGWQFWHQYLITQVLQRGITTDMQGMSAGDYFTSLWSFDQPWSAIGIMLPFALLIKKKSEAAAEERRVAFLGLLSAALIFVFFAIAKTKMWSYLVPMYPFLAIFIGAGLYYIFQNTFFSKRIRTFLYIITFAIVLSLGAFATLRDEFINLPQYYYPYIFDEKTIGDYLKNQTDANPIYLYRWQPQESLHFYSGKMILAINTPPAGGGANSGYLITITNYLGTLYNKYPIYQPIDVIYTGPTLSLLKIP